jgi:Putative MetA-pathway of phenol degradation
VGALAYFLTLVSSCTLIGMITNILTPLPISAQPAAGELETEAEEARRALDIFLREQRVLFKRGELALELDTFYASDAKDQFIGVSSGTQLTKITTRSATALFIPRYGLLDNLELDLEIPSGWAEQEIDLGVTRIHRSDQGVGDIAGDLRYQLWPERGARPEVILELRGKSRTGGDTLLGTGHWNVEGGVSLVKTLDPVVFFGRLGYAATLERQGVDPGDQVRYIMGMGYSLNDRVSLSMRVDGAYVGRTQAHGTAIPRSSLDIISLQFNVTTRATRNWFIEPFVNSGLTDDAPDAIVGINVLYLFSAARQQR